MSATELLEPILKGGIRSVNFFNGRLLSAEDLSDEQNANREGRRLLGQAVGDGVAYGFEVTKSGRATRQSPVVTVNAGLAFNRQGQALRLPTQTDVSLVRQAGATAGAAVVTFGNCQQLLQGGVYVAGAGAYLLTVAPAEGREERAPVSGLGNATAACGARYRVEGVQFRLLQLDLAPSDLSDTAHLRNRLAYKFFGTGFGFGSFSAGPQLAGGTLFDTLRPQSLTDYDVPLAVVNWTAGGGVEFVDLWSVRRRLTARTAAGERWSLLVGDGRAGEVEAMFLQFEDQVRDILSKEPGAAAAIVATQRFDFLPPAGLLPLSSATTAGFGSATFFAGRVQRITQRSTRLLRSLFHEASYHEPINLKSGSDRVHLYTFLENPALAAFASQSLAERFLNDPVMGGDVSGTASAATVRALQGVEVSGAAPEDGQVLKFDAAAGAYVPSSVVAERTALGAPAAAVATGTADREEFEPDKTGGGTNVNVRGDTKINLSQARATRPIEHGFGPVPVAIVVGIEGLGDFGGFEDRERLPELYVAIQDTGDSTLSFYMVAEVARPYNGRFRLVTNSNTLRFFDRVRWWAIRRPASEA